ncbi:MAG: hypothetical protein JWO62_1989 [Acidimicrobiaceae bacterium]|nr:hypothetical protein [Acidimicrobiaceae bacterium]
MREAELCPSGRLHASLRLTQRGWKTLPFPAPDGSGALALTLDLWTYRVVLEHSGGRIRKLLLTPNRAVGQVTRDVLEAVRHLVDDVAFDPTPRETPWTTPLYEDDDRATYDAVSVDTYFARATQANPVLDALRGPYRGRSTSVSAWWGTFDLPTSLLSGRQVEPPASSSSLANQPTRSRSRSAGGRGAPATRDLHSSPTRIRRPKASMVQWTCRRRRTGTPISVSTSSIATTPGLNRTRHPSRSNSVGP